MSQYYWLISGPSIRSLRSNLGMVELQTRKMRVNRRQGACAPRMKIALKYGIAVTLIIAAWVALKHFVLHIEGSSAQLADLAVFNLSAIVALMMGIKEKRLANGDRLTFLQGLGTGVWIALTYAILTSLYFALLLRLIGPRLMQQEGETNMTAAFLGLGIGLLLFGTIFSLLISLVLKKS